MYAMTAAAELAEAQAALAIEAREVEGLREVVDRERTQLQVGKVRSGLHSIVNMGMHLTDLMCLLTLHETCKAELWLLAACLRMVRAATCPGRWQSSACPQC